MDVLKNKSYKDYSKLSRYAGFPYYYHSIDDKYIYGKTAWLNDETPYTSYRVKPRDTWDSLALEFYNNPTLYWVICSFNRVADPYTTPEVGSYIKIPSISSIEFEE